MFALRYVRFALALGAWAAMALFAPAPAAAQDGSRTSLESLFSGSFSISVDSRQVASPRAHPAPNAIVVAPPAPVAPTQNYNGPLDVRFYFRDPRTGRLFYVNTTHPFLRHEQVRIRVETSRSGYLSIVNIDTVNRASLLPTGYSGAANSMYMERSREYFVPRQYDLGFTGPAGIEYLYFIYSRQPIVDPVSIALSSHGGYYVPPAPSYSYDGYPNPPVGYPNAYPPGVYPPPPPVPPVHPGYPPLSYGYEPDKPSRGAAARIEAWPGQTSVYPAPIPASGYSILRVAISRY